MNRVTICENVLDQSTWREFDDVKDVRELLIGLYPHWPDTARIYLNECSQENDVTPHDEASVEWLGQLEGHFWVVIYPQGLEWIFIGIAIAVAAVSIGLSFLLRPSANTKNQQQQSPNNSLGARQNKERPGERIPDIFGSLRSTPDLVAVPYTVYEDNEQVEYAFMCVGRGNYHIFDIKDDTTPCSEIDGTSIEVFGPNTSPNSGDAPQVRIGSAITEQVKIVQRSNSIDGQVLIAPNADVINGNNNIAFTSAGTIVHNGTDIDFTNFFSASTVGNNQYLNIAGGASGLDLSGNYLILDVSASTITLSNPASVNAAWSSIAGLSGAMTAYGSAVLHALQSGWIGAFILNLANMTEVWANFTCSNGSYKLDSHGNQFAVDTDIYIGVTAIDGNNNPVGQENYAKGTINGSSINRLERGVTVKFTLPLSGPCQVRAVRSTNTDLSSGINVVDQVQWRDLYAVAPTGLTHFGNVTTVHSRARNTVQALTVKSRKLNMHVTRKIPILQADGTFAAADVTRSAADIICAMALDPYIGNRQTSELDLVGIYNTIQAINAYFGTDLASQFSYTFDDWKVSFEESITDVATAIFCTAYRRGSVLALFFEKQTANSTLLFNHRNKIPRSETRTITFGTVNDNDGVELDYIEPNAPNFPDVDTPMTLYFPTDRSAQNPKKVKTIGVRNNVQATFLGWRIYNKMLNQHTVTQFKATSEAVMLVNNERILVADDTRADTQAGEIVSVNGLVLELSQPVKFVVGRIYTIFLQLYDDSIQAICITPGIDDKHVVLAQAPTLSLSTDAANYARTTYWIVDDQPHPASAFLLSDKTPENGQVFNLKAIEYNDAYYSHDKDFINNVLTQNQPNYGNNTGYGASVLAAPVLWSPPSGDGDGGSGDGGGSGGDSGGSGGSGGDGGGE